MKTRSEIYYVQDLEIQFRDTFLYADAKVYKESYLYGEDQEYNYGVWVTDREVEVEEIRDEEGKFIPITLLLEEIVAEIIVERGVELE